MSDSPAARDAKLTHIDADGRALMVDVSQKPITTRMARASGRVTMTQKALTLALSGGGKKGDVRAVAELAGVMAAKKTADLIPLCHPLPLSSVKVEIAPHHRPEGRPEGRAEQASDDPASAPGDPAPAAPALIVTARVKTTGPTGVEMEALTAVSAACLTIYDMLKAVDKTMAITDIVLLEKTGGASGDYQREDQQPPK